MCNQLLRTIQISSLAAVIISVLLPLSAGAQQTCPWPDPLSTPFTREVVQQNWTCLQDYKGHLDPGSYTDFESYWKDKSPVFLPLIQIDQSLRQGNKAAADRIVDNSINTKFSTKSMPGEGTGDPFGMAPTFVDANGNIFNLMLGELSPNVFGYRLISQELQLALADLHSTSTWQDQQTLDAVLARIQKKAPNVDAVADVCRFLQGQANCFCTETAQEILHCPLGQAFAMNAAGPQVFAMQNNKLSLIPALQPTGENAPIQTGTSMSDAPTGTMAPASPPDIPTPFTDTQMEGSSSANPAQVEALPAPMKTEEQNVASTAATEPSAPDHAAPLQSNPHGEGSILTSSLFLWIGVGLLGILPISALLLILLRKRRSLRQKAPD